jgi:hypothetical protein
MKILEHILIAEQYTTAQLQQAFVRIKHLNKKRKKHAGSNLHIVFASVIVCCTTDLSTIGYRNINEV